MASSVQTDHPFGLMEECSRLLAGSTSLPRGWIRLAAMDALRRGLAQRRSVMGLVMVAVVAVAVVLVFTGTLSRSTSVETSAEKMRAEVAALQARVDVGDAEVEFLETDAFVEQVARSVGLGERGEQGERPFSLRPGSPSPPPITPLGSEPVGGTPVAPFDAWMDLLFGA
jgi:hypothetical protein